MIRESLDPGSKHFSIFLTKACGNPNWAALYRSNTNGSTSHMNPTSMSDRKMHVMISKTGNSFQVYAKPIGSASWIDAGVAQTIDFSSNSFFVGVAVTAHDTSQTATLKGSEFKVHSAVVRKILVKHDLRADYPLSIGELQVYDSAGVNRALSKPTSTSSSCCGNAYPASNGVNGNLHDFTHTENGNGMYCEKLLLLFGSHDKLNSCVTLFFLEWWQVDLQTDIDVKNVVLHNRVDCCRERLSGVLVSLLDKNDGVIGSYRIGDASATDMFDIDISSFTSATSLNPSDNINVWYETLSKDKSLRQNTHGYATKLCESKGEILLV